MSEPQAAAPLRILIVDDEELARRRLKQLIEPYGARFSTDEAASGPAALERLAAAPPDIVLLDVEMPKMTGFELLQQLETWSFQVIFQTAYDEFAIKGFEVNACDYLLKPVTPEALARALERAAQRRGAAEPPPGVESLVSAAPLARFVVKAGSRSRIVEASDVERFSSQEHVTYLHLPDVSFAIDLSLTALDARLDKTQFLRIHRNAIVAVRCVASFTTGSDMTVTLKSGETLKVARDRHKAVRAALAGESG